MHLLLFPFTNLTIKKRKKNDEGYETGQTKQWKSTKSQKLENAKDDTESRNSDTWRAVGQPRSKQIYSAESRKKSGNKDT